jgi:hypothetical protein
MDITKGIAAILDGDGNAVGTGFMAAPQIVVTCAHVIDQAGAKPGGEVTLRFVVNSTAYPAVVELVDPADSHDLAILKLERAPAMAEVLPLGSSVAAGGQRFVAFGFPRAGDFNGLFARGEITGDVKNEANNRFLQISSSAVAPGMSGGPLWDESRRAVIGIVTSGFNFHAEKRLRDESFATPVDVLYRLYPALKPTEINPYRSLESFGEADAEFFFGRDALRERLLERLRAEPRFLAVLGPSGSGKSSVVQAGLFPRLRQGGVSSFDGCEILAIRPGLEPFARLAEIGLPSAEDDLPGAVHRWLKDHPNFKRLVLFIDQFEELFTVCPPDARQKFAAALLQLLESPLNCTVIITMRDDFYSRFNGDLDVWSAWLERGLVNVPLTMTSHEFRAIIEAPANALGVWFEPSLPDLILADIRAANPEGNKNGRSTILPLLEFALTRLWDRRENNTLTGAAYQEIGGVTGSLAQWANDSFYAMTKKQQALARHILTALVNINDEKNSQAYTKRSMPIHDLIRSEAEKADLLDVIGQLAKNRLLATSRNDSNVEIVEIIHEALLREWALLAQWLKEDHEFLAWQQNFSARRKHWDANQRDPGLLLGGKDLKDALDWQKNRPDSIKIEEKEFISLSKKAAGRSTSQRRLLLGLGWSGLGLVALILIFWMAIAKPWIDVMPIPTATPALTQVFIYSNGLDSLTAPARAAIEKAFSTNHLSMAPAPHPDNLTLQFSPADGENITLAMTLPETPAHRLDFFIPLREFGPEKIATGEAVSIIRAAAAYSIGQYEKSRGMLINAKSATGQALLAQASLLADDLDTENNFARYNQAIDAYTDAGFDEKPLYMGRALARWRGVPYQYKIIIGGKEAKYEDICTQTFTDYRLAYDPQDPSQGELYGIILLTDKYCSVSFEKLKWQNPWVSNLTTVASPDTYDAYEQLRQAIDPDVTYSQKEEYLLAASQKLTLANYELYNLYKLNSYRCPEAVQGFESRLFSHIEQQKDRLIKKNPCMAGNTR